jgi:uncharacterized protein (TIGR02246 family)
MRNIRFLLLLLLVAPIASEAVADDREDIEALIAEYNRTEEAMDMAAQSRLMTADRIWVTGAGRRTDNEQNLEIQQAGMDRNKHRFPGTQAFHEIRDPIIRIYGDDAAAVSFYWYRNFVPAPDEEGPNVSQRLVQSLFLVKENGTWKIAHSHASAFHPDNQ